MQLSTLPGRPASWSLLLLVPLLLLGLQVYWTAGITYSLDDAYIHLALARHILHGHYGINAGEFSAPASSILWPFLLAPFAATPFYEWMPLILNAACLWLTAWWAWRWLCEYLSWGWALTATVVLAFALNVYGLVFTGMESSLQIALVVVIGVSLVRGTLQWPFWLAVIVLPLVRYEGFAISLPVLAWLFLDGEKRAKAVAAGIVIVAVAGGFSFFLYLSSGEWLPSSVLAKHGTMQEVKGVIVLTNILSLRFFVAVALFAGWLYWREGRLGEWLLLMAAPAALHMLFGRYGWSGRYHMYWIVWTLILAWPVYARSRFVRLTALNLLLLAGFAYGTREDIRVTLMTPQASRNIHDQQRQLAIIVRDFLDAPVAVNDIGFISLYSRRYVLDLVGLGSHEVLKLRAHESPGWMEQVMARRKVDYAIIYDTWFEHRPASWIRVATLRLPEPVINPYNAEVSFYATNAEAAGRLRQALLDYSARTPYSGLKLEAAPL
jgi:hypothetical protein